jgi:hypothetical protein
MLDRVDDLRKDDKAFLPRNKANAKLKINVDDQASGVQSRARYRVCCTRHGSDVRGFASDKRARLFGLIVVALGRVMAAGKI